MVSSDQCLQSKCSEKYTTEKVMSNFSNLTYTDPVHDSEQGRDWLER